MQHDLQRSPQLDTEALDEGFVRQQKKSGAVHLLLPEDVGKLLAVGGVPEEAHHLRYRPLADIVR